MQHLAGLLCHAELAALHHDFLQSLVDDAVLTHSQRVDATVVNATVMSFPEHCFTQGESIERVLFDSHAVACGESSSSEEISRIAIALIAGASLHVKKTFRP